MPNTQTYTPTTWDEGTPFNPDNMNNIEQGIVGAYQLTRYEVDAGANVLIRASDYSGSANNWTATINITFAANRFSDTPSFMALPSAQTAGLVDISYQYPSTTGVTVNITRKTATPSDTYFSWQAINVTTN